MIRVTRECKGEDATGALARGVGSCLRAGDVVRLVADLGGGKTTFVRELAAGMGVRGVSSPTFVIINQYPVREGELAGGELVHVDAYRVGDVEELGNAGWDRLFEEGTGTPRGTRVALVEWPERIEGALAGAGSSLVVRLTPTGEHDRRIELEIPEGWMGRAEVGLLAANEPVRCPVSGAWVSPTSATYPFRGEREKMADLGRWFGGTYSSSRGIEPEDVEDP